MSNLELDLTFKGVVTRKASREMPRKTENGTSIYVLQEVQILEGPFKEKVITGERFLLNSKGETKEPFGVGEEILVYARRRPRLDDPNKGKWFFTLGEMTSSISDEEFDALLEESNVELGVEQSV